jgi:SAM-dependent methyltransferase
VSLAGALLRRAVAPARLLRILCALDNLLYRAISVASVWYDGGLHVKHRLTGYHDFFVERVAPGERVLDIGCGHGALAADLARRCQATVTGVDQDPAAIRSARSRHPGPGLTFVEADAHALPAGPYDVVILSNVLEHLEGRVVFLQETIARAGARRLLVRVPLFERDWRVPLKRELGVDFRLDPTHCIEYTVAEFEAEIAAAGLVIAESQVRWGEIWATCRARG